MIKRRIAPSVPLTLMLESDGTSGLTKLDFRLCFDMNAAAAIQEQTRLLLTDTLIWKHIAEPIVLGAMFWAALLANHPEYRSVDGLEIARSYVQENNAQEIIEALWKAYLDFVPQDKRELLIKKRAEEDERKKLLAAGEETENPSNQTTASEPPATLESSTGSSSGVSPDTISDSAIGNSAS